MILFDRRFLGFPIGCRAGGKDESFDLVLKHGMKKIYSPNDVILEVSPGIAHRKFYHRLCRHVHYSIDLKAAEDLLKSFGIATVAKDKFSFPQDRSLMSLLEIVHDNDFVTLL